MIKLLLFTTAGLLFAGIAMADTGKGKKKKGSKGKSCCTKSGKSCSKDKDKTVKM